MEGIRSMNYKRKKPKQKDIHCCVWCQKKGVSKTSKTATAPRIKEEVQIVEQIADQAY